MQTQSLHFGRLRTMLSNGGNGFLSHALTLESSFALESINRPAAVKASYCHVLSLSCGAIRL